MASFEQILSPGFRADVGSVVGALLKQVRWEEPDGTSGLQNQLIDYIASVKSQITAAINRMAHLEGCNLASLCLQLSMESYPSSHDGTLS